MKPKILLVDDEADIRDLMKEVLEADFDILLAPGGKEALQLARDEKPDLIVLDVLMPGLDGFLVCEYLRGMSSTKDIPIIMLTAVQETSNRIKAFNLGADDFIPKPFHPEELIARIRAKLRTPKAQEKATTSKLIRCGNLSMDPQTWETKVGTKSIQFTRIEFELVKFLIENKSGLKTRKEIVSKVWAGEDVPEKILDPHLVAIRRKLEGFNHTISTVYGSGYILKPLPKTSAAGSSPDAGK